MSKLYLITVGKLKDKHLEATEQEYLKRIRNPKLEIIECKSFEEDKEKEAAEVLKRFDKLGNNTQMVLLTEYGDTMDSPQFATWIKQTLTHPIALVVAGAAGPAETLINKADFKLSLSPLTFPHRLARILLVEQIYRAQAINRAHPYHK